MDDIDKRILNLLAQNARMTVKDIAQKVALTSPAVSERIRRMEREKIIAGYTVVYGDKVTEHQIEALISVSVAPSDHEEFLMLADHQLGVARCYHVTGSYSFILCVACSGIAELESLINHFQKFGATSSQIILSTSVDRSAGIL